MNMFQYAKLCNKTFYIKYLVQNLMYQIIFYKKALQKNQWS
jgi:hypothetical protein